jgi:hypothetical protein
VAQKLRIHPVSIALKAAERIDAVRRGASSILVTPVRASSRGD